MGTRRTYRLSAAVLLIIGILLALVAPANSSVGAQLPTIPIPFNPPPIPTASLAVPELGKTCDSWRIEVDVPMGVADVSQVGGVQEGADYLRSQLPNIQGLPIHILSSETSDGGANYTIVVEGVGVPLLKQVLFVHLRNIVDVMNLPAEINLSGMANAGDQIKFLLSLVASTGQKWSLDDLPDTAELIMSEIECTSHAAPGTPQTQTLIVKMLESGNILLKLLYGRIWEEIPKPPIRITLNLCDLPELFDLANDLIDKLSGEVPVASAPAENLESGSSRSSLDWSSSNNPVGTNIMTGVKDQGSCGSCWAFGSVGVMEAAIKLHGGPDTNLSEQYLVSCNSDGWSCNGGWWAHDYHISKQGNQNNSPGAVLESDFPYSASNGTCKNVSNHPYALSSWANCGDESLESVSTIKAALEQYGPVAAAVCASDSFMSYSGGVYDKQECGNVNHAIVIVGWDDATESWKIRNSWGSGWGEGGYMRIKWGVNGIGHAANYVVAGGSVLPTVAPLVNTTPTFTATPTSTPTPANNQTVVPNDTPVPAALDPGTYDDSNTGLVYTGNWYIFNGDGPMANTVHYSNSVGNGVSFAFNGSRFSVGYTSYMTRGIMVAWVDGNYAFFFNEFGPTLGWQNQWNSPDLGSGTHVVNLQHGLGLQTDVDFITIE